MLGKLFLLFVVLPLLELYLLLQLASYIGVLETVAVVVVTGVVGGFVARLQGLNAVRRIQWKLARRQSPSDEITDGALILVGGALLVTPGLITDAIGFFLLLPFTRPVARRYVQRRFRERVDVVRSEYGWSDRDDEEVEDDPEFEGFDERGAVDVDWEER